MCYTRTLRACARTREASLPIRAMMEGRPPPRSQFARAERPFGYLAYFAFKSLRGNWQNSRKTKRGLFAFCAGDASPLWLRPESGRPDFPSPAKPCLLLGRRIFDTLKRSPSFQAPEKLLNPIGLWPLHILWRLEVEVWILSVQICVHLWLTSVSLRLCGKMNLARSALLRSVVPHCALLRKFFIVNHPPPSWL
jgi:hypothetical protein